MSFYPRKEPNYDLVERACSAFQARSGVSPSYAKSYWDNDRNRVVLMSHDDKHLGEYAAKQVPYTNPQRWGLKHVPTKGN